jgi:hypothetical protein
MGKIALVENVFSIPQARPLRISADVTHTVREMFLIANEAIEIITLPQAAVAAQQRIDDSASRSMQSTQAARTPAAGEHMSRGQHRATAPSRLKIVCDIQARSGCSTVLDALATIRRAHFPIHHASVAVPHQLSER